MSDTFYPKIDGVAVSMKNFAERLSLKGHEFLILCPRYGEDDFNRMGDGIRVERFRSAYLPSYPDIKVVLPSPKKLKRFIEEFQPDVVHIHTPGLMGLYGVNLVEKYGIPTIGTYHTLMAEQDMYVSFYRLLKLDKLFSRIGNFDKKLRIKDILKFIKLDNLNIRKKIILKLCNDIYDRCDLVISPSHLIKNQLQEYGLKKPIAVVSNGLDLKVFLKGSRKLSSSPKILHVGRISYEKNCDVVVSAFAEIHKKIPNATFTIIGDGPAIPSLKLQVEKLGISNAVIFTGFIPNVELPNHYPQYDLFLTASTMETQGLVLLESLASGLPAVGVNSFAIPELVHHERNGFIAEPFQPQQMADLAIRILENPQMYEAFSKESIKIAESHDINRSVEEMEKIYETIKDLPEKKKKKSFLENLISQFQ